MASVETTPPSGPVRASIAGGIGVRRGAVAAASGALRDSRPKRTQAHLARAGAVLLPLGVLLIVGGWLAAADPRIKYDSTSLVWVGFSGIAVTCVGTCLYIGSWLSRIAIENRASSERLASTVLMLADAIARAPGGLDIEMDVDALRVTAGGGSTVHQRNCPLVSDREDLALIVADDASLVRCRVCRP